MRDAAMTSSAVRQAYEDFLSGTAPTPESVRSLVRESWTRSAQRGVSPGGGSAIGANGRSMDDSDLAAYRNRHPMRIARPLVQSLLLDDVSDSGGVVALTDQLGRLLWVEGSHTARDRASRIDFVEGAVWSEEVAGTNAPGLALQVDKGVQIVGPEHFAGPVQNWSCAAAPVHDPRSGDLIGVVDVTGGSEVATPFALSTVRSVVAAVERELLSHSTELTDFTTYDDRPRAELTVLSDNTYRWRRAGDRAPRALSKRHAEILILLQAFPEGLSTEQLALLLAEDGLDPVTVRAEISRLRRDLGADVVTSRPYRLTIDLTSDFTAVRDQVGRGDLVGAIDQFGRGGLLVESSAPGITELFEETRESLRSRLTVARDATALRKWTASAHGRDDVPAWHALRALLPEGASDRAAVDGQLRVLDRRFGIA